MNDYQDYDENYENTDCLVLEIYSDESNKTFILYDFYKKNYIIKGLNNLQNYFSFRCKHSTDILNFINFMSINNNKVSILLHNYKNIPYEYDNIYFDLLNDISIDNPYSGNILVSKEINLGDYSSQVLIEDKLKILKNLYNIY